MCAILFMNTLTPKIATQRVGFLRRRANRSEIKLTTVSKNQEARQTSLWSITQTLEPSLRHNNVFARDKTKTPPGSQHVSPTHTEQQPDYLLKTAMKLFLFPIFGADSFSDIGEGCDVCVPPDAQFLA